MILYTILSKTISYELKYSNDDDEDNMPLQKHTQKFNNFQAQLMTM